MNVCEPIYFIDLRFPKKALVEILRNQDKDALLKLVEESLSNYMEEYV